MFTNLKKRYGVIGPVAILALIVAVAFAGVPAVAQPVGNTSANAFKLIKRALRLGTVANKRSVNAIKIARATSQQQGPAGADGAQGPKGDKGDKGTAGKQGENGTNGTDGADGNTVLSGTGIPGAGVGVDGDFYIDTSASDMYGPKTAGNPNNGWGFPTSLKGADGDDGEPWTVGGTLPSGETLTGTWYVSTETGAAPFQGSGELFSISFEIPLDAQPADFEYVDSPGGGTNCTGIDTAPTAPADTLCLYESGAANMAFGGPVALSHVGGWFGYSTTPGSAGFAFGTWAVTG